MYSFGTEVESTTNILGIGEIGSAVIDVLDACGMKNAKLISLPTEKKEQYVQLSRLLPSSDILILVGDFVHDTNTEAAMHCAAILKNTATLILAVTISPSTNDERQLSKHFKLNLLKIKGAVESLVVIPADSTNSPGNACAHAVKKLHGFTQHSDFMSMDYGVFRYTLRQNGSVAMGFGIGAGESRALNAAIATVSSPQFGDHLLENCAESVLISISWGSNFSWDEFKEVMFYFTEYFSGDKRLLLAEVRDDSLGKDMCVTMFPVFPDE